MPETAKEMFTRVYEGGKNFMTPDVIRYGFRGMFAYELSQGRGIYDETIYGVTLLNRYSGEKLHELSKCCHSRAEAESFINSLSAD